jgi:hypothetical protein
MIDDTAGQCLVCGKDSKRLACVDCFVIMQQQLNDIPEFYALAGGEYWSQGVSRNGGGSSERSLGLRVEALDARSPRNTISVLEEWERDWRETLDVFGNDEHALRSQRSRKAGEWNRADTRDLMGLTLIGVTRFLLKHLDSACLEHPAIDVFAQELGQAHKRLKAAAREPSEQVSIIECPADWRDGICKAELRLVPGSVQCEQCGTMWDQARLLMVAKSAGVDTWQPAGVISEYLGVAPSTLSSWARQGHVRRKGTSYLWSSVVAHIADSRPHVDTA